VSPEALLRDIVATQPAAAEVFDVLDIDYFCRGGRTLGEALKERATSLQEFAAECASRARATHQDAPPCLRDLRTLIDYILEKHHAYVHRELPLLAAMIEDSPLRETFARFHRDIEVQMRKEETILFPAIVAVEIAAGEGRDPDPLPFGRVANFSRTQQQQHCRTAATLSELRSLVQPARESPLRSRLLHLIADVRYHIHLEDNVLFPRAVELERHSTRVVEA